MSFNSEDHRKEIIESKSFKAKNYKNSPVIREFYRFVAKNNLRNDAFKIVEKASKVKSFSYSDYMNDVIIQ